MHLLLATAALIAQTQIPVEITTYSFWRPPNVTAVNGVIAVPLARLQFAPDSAAASQAATYQVAVQIHDSDGNRLHSDGWSRRVELPAGRVSSRAQAVEHLAFDLAPGTYRLSVEVTDSAAGSRSRTEHELHARPDRPVTGSLALASRIQQVDAAASVPQGAFVRNGLAITPNLAGHLRAEEPNVALYTEVYPPGDPADTATVSIVVRGIGSSFRQERQVARRVYPADGGVEALQVPLAGLAPGGYLIGLRLQFPDTTVVVERGLTVAAPEPEVASLFGEATEPQLDSLFAMAGYITDHEERTMYRSLSLEGKRRFMDAFWAERDPTPGGTNEFYREYMRRLEFANRNFAQRGGVAGWASDRGRIFLVYGPPAERYIEPGSGSSQKARPYEIWKYVEGRGAKYVFHDLTSMGTFRLVYTNNPEEPSLPNWRDFFDQEALDLIDRFK